jgi:hypothetical protein
LLVRLFSLGFGGVCWGSSSLSYQFGCGCKEMAKKSIIHDDGATKNLGYLIKVIAGTVVIIGVILYMIFSLKPNFDQMKEIMIYIIIYLMGYGTKELTKKNGK